jgi:hypothetical protein
MRPDRPGPELLAKRFAVAPKARGGGAAVRKFRVGNVDGVEAARPIDAVRQLLADSRNMEGSVYVSSPDGRRTRFVVDNGEVMTPREYEKRTGLARLERIAAKREAERRAEEERLANLPNDAKARIEWARRFRESCDGLESMGLTIAYDALFLFSHVHAGQALDKEVVARIRSELVVLSERLRAAQALLGEVE